MKFSDLRFAQKLGLGFGALILIAVILGLLAVINMSGISTKSEYLANEYVPEVKVSNNIERYSLLTMYDIRGYGYTEEKDFLTKGQENLKKVEDFLLEAERLAANSTQLVKLNEAAVSTRKSVDTYEELVNKTIEANKYLEDLRNRMDQSAKLFMDNCSSYLEDQNNLFEDEIRSGADKNKLTERYSKISWINNVVENGNEVRLANFKAQSKRDPVAYENAIRNFDIAGKLEMLRSKTHTNANMKALDNVETAAKDYIQNMQNFLKTWKEREDLNNQRNDAGQNVLEKAQEVAMAGISNTNEIAYQAVSMLNTSSFVMIAGLIVAIFLGIILAIILTGSVTKGLKRGVKFAEQVADGDLTVDLEEEYVIRKDEIGNLSKALKNMVIKLREIVENILAGSESISSASQQMATTAQEMSQGSSEQASSVEEVSSSMEQMVSNIQQNTDNAQQTEKISTNASKGILEGSNATNTAVDAMKNIADKIRIINDIAFQTNILALNAAVEAARAGEHGKGFAVVAAEVRKLAERSKIAADEIDELSRNGVSIAEKAGLMLSEIVPEIEKTSKLVQEIAAASLEQNGGANQVNNAIQQLNTVTQQNAAASEEVATSSEELASQAEQLKDTIQYFKIDRSRAFSINTDYIKSKNKIKIGHINKEKKKQKVSNNPEEELIAMKEQNSHNDDEFISY